MVYVFNIRSYSLISAFNFFTYCYTVRTYKMPIVRKCNFWTFLKTLSQIMELWKFPAISLEQLCQGLTITQSSITWNLPWKAAIAKNPALCKYLTSLWMHRNQHLQWSLHIIHPLELSVLVKPFLAIISDESLGTAWPTMPFCVDLHVISCGC